MVLVGTLGATLTALLLLLYFSWLREPNPCAPVSESMTSTSAAENSGVVSNSRGLRLTIFLLVEFLIASTSLATLVSRTYHTIL